jgi:hypothetical protein
MPLLAEVVVGGAALVTERRKDLRDSTGKGQELRQPAVGHLQMHHIPSSGPV